MPKKVFTVQDIGSVAVYRHRTAKSLRVTIQPDGNIRVTVPYWLPYRAGITFALSRKRWIEQHRAKRQLLQHNQHIGKSHRINLLPSDTDIVRTRVSQMAISITYPHTLSQDHETVQLKARKAAHKALKQQAETLLPRRLESLARLHDFEYRSVSVRNLRSRWGSCSQQGDITLSLFLMILPWELIDYVLLHELTHTKVHSHGPKFWHLMESCNPQAKELRKKLKQFHPVI